MRRPHIHRWYPKYFFGPWAVCRSCGKVTSRPWWPMWKEAD